MDTPWHTGAGPIDVWGAAILEQVAQYVHIVSQLRARPSRTPEGTPLPGGGGRVVQSASQPFFFQPAQASSLRKTPFLQVVQQRPDSGHGVRAASAPSGVPCWASFYRLLRETGNFPTCERERHGTEHGTLSFAECLVLLDDVFPNPHRQESLWLRFRGRAFIFIFINIYYSLCSIIYGWRVCARAYATRHATHCTSCSERCGCHVGVPRPVRTTNRKPCPGPGTPSSIGCTATPWCTSPSPKACDLARGGPFTA